MPSCFPSKACKRLFEIWLSETRRTVWVTDFVDYTFELGGYKPIENQRCFLFDRIFANSFEELALWLEHQLPRKPRTSKRK
jgi:hypothetical protein